jgi:hypothetical protein
METAVEWIEGYLKKFNHIQESLSLRKAFEQAKAMHKQEIINTYRDGRSDQQSEKPSRFYNRMAEQYYNETFKSE